MTIKKITRSIALAALFLVPFFPLFPMPFWPFDISNSLFFPFITGKAFYFRVLVEIVFAGWLILCCLDAKYRPKLSPLTIGVTVFALVTLLADLLGVNPLRSMWSNFERMEGWITIIHLWAFFIATVGFFGAGEEGRRLWHRWLNFEIVAALIVGIYGLCQFFGWAAIHQGSTRIDASLGNAAYMAVYMLWNTGLAAYMFFVARAKKIKNAGFLQWAYPVLAVLFAFEVFETATRGTILGLAGAVMLACFLYAVLGKNEKSVHRWSAAGVIALVILSGVGLYAAKNTSFVQNHDVLNRLATISISDAQGQARGYIWPMALKGAAARPILGWGQENFNYIFNANYDAKMWKQEQWFDRAHSVYLDWLTASGAIGLLAYLSLYALFLMAVWKSQLSLAEKSVLTGLLAGYAVHNFFVFDNLASYALFFAAMALVGSFKEGKPLRFLGTSPMSAEAVEYAVAPAAIIALVAVVYFFSIRPIQANTRLIAALSNCGNPQAGTTLFDSALAVNAYVANQETREQLLSCSTQVIASQQSVAALKQSFFSLASQAIQDQIKATPLKDARIYMLGGTFLEQVGQYGQAQGLLETAHELSPAKQSIDLGLADSYINTGQSDKAVDLLKQAYLSATDNDNIRTAYVMALVTAGRDAEAKKIPGIDQSIFQTETIARAYMIAKQYDKALPIYQALSAANPTDVNTTVKLAQAQYAAGLVTAAVATLRSIEKSHPEYKDQVEASIKQIQP